MVQVGITYTGGGVHGAAQILEKRIKKVCRNSISARINSECFSFKLLKTCITFFFVVFAWIFFRADSLRSACEYIFHMANTILEIPFDLNTLFSLGMSHIEWGIVMFAIVVLFCVDKVRYKYGLRLDSYLNMQNIWFKWGICIFLFCYTLIFGVYGPESIDAAFLYFQF